MKTLEAIMAKMNMEKVTLREGMIFPHFRNEGHIIEERKLQEK